MKDNLKFLSSRRREYISFSAVDRMCQVIGSMRPLDSASGMKFIGETMVPLVQSRFMLRTVGSVQVKGKTVPVRVFTVMADKEAGEQPPAWLPRYEDAIKLYRERKFAEAEAIFLECLRAQPDDHLSKLYMDECRELLAHPPGLDWNTVVVMKSK